MDTIQQEVRNNHKIKVITIIAFIIAMIVMVFAYMDTLIFSTLMLIDVKDFAYGFKLLIASLDVKIGLIFFPPIFFFIGLSKYYKNTRYISKYYKYKEILEILDKETFKMHKTFYNKEEFFFSKNWLYIDEVLIPRFLIKEIKIKQSKIYNKICIILKNGQVYYYNPRNNGKLFLDMAKMIDFEFKNTKEDVEVYFEPVDQKKIFSILNNVSLIFSVVGMIAFLIFENIQTLAIPLYWYNIVKISSLSMVGLSFIENIISIIKRQTEKNMWIAFIINILFLLLLLSLVLCLNFMLSVNQM